MPSVVPPRLVRIIDMHGGGAEGTRTPDPHTASVVLSQLSYSPLCSIARYPLDGPGIGGHPGSDYGITAAIRTGEFGHMVRHFHRLALATGQPTTPVVQPRLQDAMLAERANLVNRVIAGSPSPDPSLERRGEPPEPPPGAGALWAARAVSGGSRGLGIPAITSDATRRPATRRRRCSGDAPGVRIPRASVRR
jgi:hypothetical protein